jgi:hypothetical protein
VAYQQSFDIPSRGRGSTEITAEVARVVRAAGVASGLAHVFVQHTSCSVVLTENADPSVRRDLETLAARWAPDGDAAYGITTARATTTWRRTGATFWPVLGERAGRQRCDAARDLAGDLPLGAPHDRAPPLGWWSRSSADGCITLAA